MQKFKIGALHELQAETLAQEFRMSLTSEDIEMIKEDYLYCLSDLITISKPIINNLTILAREYMEMGEELVSIIQTRLETVNIHPQIYFSSLKLIFQGVIGKKVGFIVSHRFHH